MNKTHLVMITTSGYSLVSSHDVESAAIVAMAKFRAKHRAVCVLRHGSTGKRESVSEVEQRIRLEVALTQFEASESIWRRLAA